MARKIVAHALLGTMVARHDDGSADGMVDAIITYPTVARRRWKWSRTPTRVTNGQWRASGTKVRSLRAPGPPHARSADAGTTSPTRHATSSKSAAARAELPSGSIPHGKARGGDFGEPLEAPRAGVVRVHRLQNGSALLALGTS